MGDLREEWRAIKPRLPKGYLVSKDRSVVLAQYHDEGVNFRITRVAEPGHPPFRYQTTVFDRSLPAAELAPPTITIYADREAALAALFHLLAPLGRR